MTKFVGIRQVTPNVGQICNQEYRVNGLGLLYVPLAMFDLSTLGKWYPVDIGSSYGSRMFGNWFCRVQTQSVCTGQYTVDVCIEDMRIWGLNWLICHQIGCIQINLIIGKNTPRNAVENVHSFVEWILPPNWAAGSPWQMWEGVKLESACLEALCRLRGLKVWRELLVHSVATCNTFNSIAVHYCSSRCRKKQKGLSSRNY